MPRVSTTFCRARGGSARACSWTRSRSCSRAARSCSRGLHIHEGWEWSERRPVVRLDFGRGHFGEPGLLEANVMEQLAGAERRTGVVPEYLTAPGRFAYLLEALHERTGQRVAVLVDEYDKPILDALETRATALANRDFLRGLYGVIKSSDAHVHFTFLTGVSKFTKVSVFSQLNNLTDLTLDRRYSAICGYTERDLDEVFAPELAGLDREQVREWYNGYCWRRRGEGVQPVRRAAAVRQPRVRRALVRDGDAGVSGGDAVRAPRLLGVPGPDVEHGRSAVRVRHPQDRHRGAAVPDRVPDDHGGREAGRHGAVSAGLSRTGRYARA